MNKQLIKITWMPLMISLMSFILLSVLAAVSLLITAVNFVKPTKITKKKLINIVLLLYV